MYLKTYICGDIYAQQIVSSQAMLVDQFMVAGKKEKMGKQRHVLSQASYLIHLLILSIICSLYIFCYDLSFTVSLFSILFSSCLILSLPLSFARRSYPFSPIPSLKDFQTMKPPASPFSPSSSVHPPTHSK